MITNLKALKAAKHGPESAFREHFLLLSSGEESSVTSLADIQALAVHIACPVELQRQVLQSFCHLVQEY